MLIGIRDYEHQPCAESSGSGPSRLQLARLVAAVVEVESLGQARQKYTQHDLESPHSAPSSAGRHSGVRRMDEGRAQRIPSPLRKRRGPGRKFAEQASAL